MTVVAVYRGKLNSHNAMVVDTICTARDRPDECAFWTDKLTLVFGSTYATAVGDADVINGLRLVVDFLDPHRPNLREGACFAAILGAVERIWAVRETAGAQRYGSKGLVLFLCTRADVFYWVAGYDNEKQRFERVATGGDGCRFHRDHRCPGARRWWGEQIWALASARGTRTSVLPRGWATPGWQDPAGSGF